MSQPRVGGAVNALPVEGRVNELVLRTIFGMDNNILVIELTEPDPPVAAAPVPPSDLFLLFNRRRAEVRQVVATFMTQHPRVKLSLGLQTVFTRRNGDGVQTIKDYARTATEEITNVEEDLTRMFDRAVHHLWLYIENFVRGGSNWVLDHYKSVILHVYALPPLAVGLWQRTPRELSRKGCIINVQSHDNYCFKWAIVASVLYRASSASDPWDWHEAKFPAYYEARTSAWQHLDFSSITPGQLVTGHTVNLFEQANPDYAINLFTYVNMDAVLEPNMRPGRLTAQETKERKKLVKQFHVSQHVHNQARTLFNLLLLENPVTGEYHAVAITNLDTFFNERHHSVKVCPKCLQVFVRHTADARNRAFTKHRDEFCGDPKYDRYNVDFPETHLSFTNSALSMRLPFHIFADFETFGQAGKNYLNHDTSQRTVINRHRIMAYSLGVMTTPGVSDHLQSQFPQKSYCGPNAEEQFVADFITVKTRIRQAIETMRQKYKNLKPRSEFTPEEQALAAATHCHICGGEITNHGRHWKRDQRLWEAFFEDNDILIIDEYSLPSNYWRGPRVVDHCHLR